MTNSERTPKSEFRSDWRRPCGFRYSDCFRLSTLGFRTASRSAFTLMELLVVLAIFAILGATLLVAAPRSRLDVQNILCLNGKRQLCLAWRLYADDNAGKLVPNTHGGQTVGGSGGAVSWAVGW